MFSTGKHDIYLFIDRQGDGRLVDRRRCRRRRRDGGRGGRGDAALRRRPLGEVESRGEGGVDDCFGVGWRRGEGHDDGDDEDDDEEDDAEVEVVNVGDDGGRRIRLTRQAVGHQAHVGKLQDEPDQPDHQAYLSASAVGWDGGVGRDGGVAWDERLFHFR